MKVLLSALACAPGHGSEPEAGFRALLAAASRHEVWALVTPWSANRLQRFLDGHELRDRVHIISIPFDLDELHIPDPPRYHRAYDRWQRHVEALAPGLHKSVRFDVTHHATLAAYWVRAGVAVVPRPFVWGPVGGGVETPLPLLSALGVRGIAEDGMRYVTRRVLAAVGPARVAQRAADVVLLQNEETARRLTTGVPRIVLPNALGVVVPEVSEVTRGSDVVVASRLIPWKGLRLALDAWSYVTNEHATLRVFGEGPAERGLRVLARRLQIDHRIAFEGRASRDQLLHILATAGVLLHPALHEEGGLSVAEALAYKTPVVCLAQGGPQELLRRRPESPSTAIPIGPPRTTALRMAAAIDRHLADPPAVGSTAPRDDFARTLLEAYELAVNGSPHPP